MTICALGWPASHGGDGVDAGGGVADCDGSPLPWAKQGGVRMNRMIVSNTMVATGIGWRRGLSLAVVGCRTVILVPLESATLFAVGALYGREVSA